MYYSSMIHGESSLINGGFMSTNGNDQTFEPTPLQRLVSVLNNTGREQYIGLLFLEALTHRAGVSRNRMVNSLLEVGIETVLNSLSADAFDQIREAADRVQETALAKNAGLLERGEV
jgi:hypothetical protein